MGVAALSKVALRKMLPDRWIYVLLLVMIYNIYKDSFDGAFVWDDRSAVINNGDVTGRNPISTLISNDFWGQDITLPDSHKSYRPLTVFTYRLDHYVYGLHARGFHITNAWLYFICCVSLFEFICLYRKRSAGAIIATIIFTVHPLHVENVSSIVGRADCLCGIFYLWTMMLCTLSIRSSHKFTMIISFVLSWFCAIAATLSKENGATVFLVLLALEVLEEHSSHFSSSSSGNSTYTVLVNLMRSGQRVITTIPSATRSFVNIISLLSFFQFRSWLHGDHYLYNWSIMENQISLLPVSMSRVPAYAQAHFFYVFKLFYPRHLCFDYGFDCIPTVQILFDSRNLLPLVAYVVVLYTLHISIRSCERNPITLFGLAIYIAALSPALHIFLPVGAIFAERLLFLPSMGYCISIAAVMTQWTWVHAVDDWVDRVSRKLTGDEESLKESAPELTVIESSANKKRKGNSVKHTADNQSNRLSPFLILVLLPVVWIFAIWSSKRCQAWRSELALFGAALEVCPRSLKSLTNNAMLLSSQAETRTLSLEYSKRATNIHWNNSMAFLNSAIARQKSGDFLHAIEDLQRAFVTHKSERSKIRGYLAVALVEWSQALQNGQFGLEDTMRAVRTGLMSSGIHWANESLSISQFHPPIVLFNAGVAASELQMHDEAIWLFDKGIEGMERLIKLREKSGNTVFIEDEVDLMALLNQKALALQVAGRKSDSLQSLRHAYELRPKFVPVMTNYASALRDAGETNEAKRILKQFIAESFEEEVEDAFIPAIVWNNLGYIEHTIGNFHTALSCYEQAMLSFARDPTGRMHGFDQPPSLGEVLAINLQAVKDITGL